MSSNSTSTDASVPATSTDAPSPTSTSSVPASSTSSVANSSPTPVSDTSSTTSTTSTTSLSSTTSTTSTTPLTTSTPSSTTSTTSTSKTTTSTTPITSSSSSLTTSVTTSLSTQPDGSTTTVIQTSTEPASSNSATTTTGTSSSASSSAITGLQSGSKGTSSSSGLSQGGTIAIAVIVPIVAVALIILAGLYFWRKRKARKDAEEMRRKEVEEYGYNPNNDPTLPTVAAAGAAGSDGPFEMREDGSSGYRGWGTTAVASSGRKASTTVSGGQSPGPIGMAYSDGSPTHGTLSDTRSDKPLVDESGRPISGEPEALGAMGPAAAGNRSGDINRGPSNASSSYSAANRSDGSEEINSPGGYGGGQYYNGQYDAGNPYGPDTAYGSPPGRAEMSAAPVIRDVQARRNTRIENPSHFPQQSAGISQNF